MTRELTNGPLTGLRVLDLSRILAGPTCTQLLGDMGADIIKIERPVQGDDTRGWGPPFVQDREGRDTRESAYYLSANRNKSSLALDITSTEGQAIVRELAEKCDILVENFKVGGLAKYGLDYDTLKTVNPSLIYCSITGFGQTGPYADQAGYDFLIQGMGGIMSITGEPAERGGAPTKVGVGIADVMCGMYASSAILAALHARQHTGRGQHIDIALLDSQIAWLVNQGVAHLVSGQTPQPLGNGHPTIVPYETFPASDQHFILAVGNDNQFRKFCSLAGCEELADNPDYATNANRVRNRDALVPLVAEVTGTRTAQEWIDLLSANAVPCGPVNDIAQVFADPSTTERGMKITLAHAASAQGSVDLIGNPINYSDTAVTYRKAPPELGEHSAEVLRTVLNKSDDEIAELAEKGTIGLHHD